MVLYYATLAKLRPYSARLSLLSSSKNQPHLGRSWNIQRSFSWELWVLQAGIQGKLGARLWGGELSPGSSLSLQQGRDFSLGDSVKQNKPPCATSGFCPTSKPDQNTWKKNEWRCPVVTWPVGIWVPRGQASHSTPGLSNHHRDSSHTPGQWAALWYHGETKIPMDAEVWTVCVVKFPSLLLGRAGTGTWVWTRETWLWSALQKLSFIEILIIFFSSTLFLVTL